MNEVEQHWEPHFSHRSTISEDPYTVDLVVMAEFSDGLHDLGGVNVFKQRQPGGSYQYKVRGWGILEYAAHALREVSGLVLMYDDNHNLVVRNDNA